MAIREIKSIRDTDADRSGINTIREVEDRRDLTKERVTVMQTVTGGSITIIETPTSSAPQRMSIANTSSDAVDAVVSLSLRMIEAPNTQTYILYLAPIPFGTTLVLDTDDLAFNPVTHTLAATLSAASGTSKADFITRF